MGLFANSPLSVRCTSLEELRSFLKKCRYVSDQKQFDKDDFWMPPAAFERSRQGDCEDFALYAWRQLLEMGYESRFVAGYSGRYGSGHAWVTAEIDGKRYVVEPLARFMHKVPRLWLMF